VATRRKSQPKNRKTPRRLLLGEAAALSSPVMIPTRWLNNVIAVFLLPVAWVLTQSFFTCFTDAAAAFEFWRTEEFWFFGLGVIMWVLAFFGTIWIYGEPQPLALYVYGHELTHAIWARAMGGKVYDFKVSSRGGYVITDKANFWIALAPYFHPLYSVIVIAVYGGISLFYDLRGYTPLLFGLLGGTWAFHLSFTLWMIPKGQSDLTTYGTFFSLVVIYLMNLAVLVALLVFAAPEVTASGFLAEMLRHAVNFADWTLRIFNAGLEHILRRVT
jgi:hypothetical protein